MLQAVISDGSNVTLGVSGNISSSDVLCADISPVQSASLTTVSLSVLVQSGANSFGNLSIPKYAIMYGTVPTIYVDNQAPQTQGYTQDDSNYYVWYTTPLSVYELSIVFVTHPSRVAFPFWAFLPVVVMSIAVILMVLVATVSVFRRRREKDLAIRLFTLFSAQLIHIVLHFNRP